MRLCLFCENPLTLATKPEHIFLNALGGRKATRCATCSLCNNRFGASIDGAMAAQVASFRTFLQLPSGDGRSPPSIRNLETRTGDRFDLRADGTPEVWQRPFHVSKIEGGFEVRVNVRDTEQLESVLPHIAAQTKLPVEEIRRQFSESTATVRRWRPGPVKQQLSIGGEDISRSITKSALALLATVLSNDVMRGPVFADARGFVVSGGKRFNEGRVYLDARPLPTADLLEARYGPLFTLLIVRSDQQGRVLAHLTLYNLLAWEVVLAEAEAPPDVSVCLVTNPLNPAVWSNETPEEGWANLEWLAHPDDCDILPRTVGRLQRALEIGQRQGRDRELEKAIYDVFKKHGVEEGDLIPAGRTREKIIADLAARAATIGLGLPHEEEVSFTDLMRRARRA